MTTTKLIMIVIALIVAQVCNAWAPGITAYTAPKGFPTSAFQSYYTLPASPTQEPQPIISDPVLSTIFPFELTNPDEIPLINTVDPLYFPTTTTSIAASSQPTYLASIVSQVSDIISSTNFDSNCTKCIAALKAAQPAAKAVPTLLPGAMVSLCQSFKYASNATCVQSYNASTFGDVW
jgi:hypothetical protein